MYKLTFISTDDPDVYINMLKKVSKSKEAVFNTQYESDFFFQKLRQYIAKMKYDHGYEILCSKYGVDGFK